MTTRVVLLEDEQILESLLSEWVGSETGLELAGAYTTGSSFVEAAREWGKDVSVMVIDVRLPDGDGIDVAAKVAESAGRQIPIVVLTGHADMNDVARVQKLWTGGWAFVSKGAAGLRHLRGAIDAAASGMVMIDPTIQSAATVPEVIAALTVQERAILASIAMGRANQAIADEHFLSLKSVERIIGSIYEKLGVNSDTKSTNPRVSVTLKYLGL